MNADTTAPTLLKSDAATTTRMYQEAATSADVVARQLEQNAVRVAAIGAALRARPPRTVVTCARGSSDHAATYGKYLIETRARILTVSAAPSVSSVYGVDQDLRDCLYIAISQSGRSPDLLSSVTAAKRSGAAVLALCNDPEAPLNNLADYSLPLCAGPERSVAATKSYIASLAALAHLTAAWTGDAELGAAVSRLPESLAAAWKLDWSPALEHLVGVSHLYVIGRGLGLGVAQEAALKCKETCGLHAEAFSSAEVRHGPFALLGEGFPALVLGQDDATRPGLEVLSAELAARGVRVMLAGATAAGVTQLPSIPESAAVAPALLAASTYRLLAHLAVARGHDPDQPPFLHKVTQTV